MKVTRVMKFAWGALKSRKLRFVLTVLGVTIGPAVIVALIGATAGFGASVTQRFNNIGITTLFVSAQLGRGGTSSTTHIDDNMAKVISQMQGVQEVVPYYSITGTRGSGQTTDQVAIIALDVSKLKSILPGMEIDQGSLPTAMSQAIVGDLVANPTDGATGVSLNGVVSISTSQRVGAKTVTEHRAFVASGILQPFGQSFFINPDSTVFIPLSAGRSITSTGYYSGLYVIASTPNDVNNVTTAISDLYGNNVRVTAISSLLSSIQSVTGGVDTILISVAFMSVIVAFIGIMTTMFTSVAERTREIGILKSLGYSPRDILGIFLSESTLTGAIGGLAGIVLGTTMSFVVVGLFGGSLGGFGVGARGANTLALTPLITPVLLLETFIMAVSIGALAGLLPSWRASKMIPVVALRHE